MLIGLLLSFAASAGMFNRADFSSADLYERYQQLTQELRCLVCQNQNLASSDAELANQLRTIIVEQLEQGNTDNQIRQFMVDRYGNFVLYDPPLYLGTLLLWFGPAILLLIGIIVVIGFVRSQARLQCEDE